MIAYFLLVHRYPAQFKRLFKAIHDPANHYLIHVDKSSGAELDAEIRDFLADYPNAAMLKGKKALWGGYSLVDATLRGMAELLRMNPDWEHFINLSGQDFPLKSQGEIARFLSQHRGTEFIKVADQELARPDTMDRVRNYVVELDDRISAPLAARPFLAGARPHIGNQWMVASRRFCQFVCHDPEAAPFKAFYRNTFIADEGFFQTVLMNSPHGAIINDDMRAIDWVPEGTIKLRPRTFTQADAAMLTASPALFARKFDAAVDADILDTLERHIRAPRPRTITPDALVAA